MTAYQKIPGTGRRLQGPVASCTCKLWLAPDHLLSVDRFGILFTSHEKYRRFYFTDIQGFTLRTTSAYRNVNILWTALLVILVALLTWVYFAMDAGVSSVVTGIFSPCALLFIALIGLNIWRGPTCRLKIHTAVQSEILLSINRIKRSRDFLALLTPLIHQAQGSLAEADVPKLYSPDLSSPLSPSADFFRPPAIPEQLTRKRGTFFMALSIGLLLHSVATAYLYFHPGLIQGAASALFGVAVSLFWMIAMIQSAKYSVTRNLRNFGWVTLGYISTLYLISIIYTSIAGMKNPALSYDAMEWLRLMGERPVAESFFLRIYDLFIIFSSGILGAIGLFLQKPAGEPTSTP